MSTLNPNDQVLRQILTATRVIAVVGHSDRSDRVSYQIAQFLRQVGYTVYPVNPAVREIEGQPCYPSLHEVPEAVDIVNVFRRSQFLVGVVEEAIGIRAKTVWAQLGIADQVAAQLAQAAGLTMVMDACIKVEYWRLGIKQ
ncbi:CoA-binding protein [Pantanalinema sp. GBBB05]|uniref:CoA-binding protein n=1 Tax=Pantanalinema sp. GBBB05 TaxID=2604139 RepID=UPI001E11FAFB|nr:CoA-binding protein [Pantanalinema sp. GBBB05]